jgi:hypothetical protein
VVVSNPYPHRLRLPPPRSRVHVPRGNRAQRQRRPEHAEKRRGLILHHAIVQALVLPVVGGGVEVQEAVEEVQRRRLAPGE